MADVSRLSGGMDSMRLSAEEQTALARRQKYATARGNLAAVLVDRAGGLERVEADDDVARMVVEEFAELCAALGLEPPPEHSPGICIRPACGNEMPTRAQMRARDIERFGYCSVRCKRLSNLSNVADVS